MSLNCDNCGSLREKSLCCSKTLPCKECVRVKKSNNSISPKHSKMSRKTARILQQ